MLEADNAAAIIMEWRHPERSSFSGGAKDLPQIVTVPRLHNWEGHDFSRPDTSHIDTGL